MINTQCSVCGNNMNNKIYHVSEMMFGYGDIFTYFECSHCGCLQIFGIPSDISKYYPPQYYSFSTKPSTSNSHRARLNKFLDTQRNRYAVFNHGLIGKILFNRSPDDRLRSLSKVSNLTKDSKILDVGCGSGLLLFTLKELGFKNLLGIDKYIDHDFQYPNGLRIQKGTLQEISGKWNLIMFHHSFEHMPEPLKTMLEASKLLTNGGTCLINLPTVSSYAWKYYGVNWVQLDAPRYFFLHSVKSLNILGEKANLTLQDVVYNSIAFQFWGSEQYLRNISLKSDRSYSKNPSNSIFTKDQIKAYEQKAKELNMQNLGDSAAFYFVKNNNHKTSYVNY